MRVKKRLKEQPFSLEFLFPACYNPLEIKEREGVVRGGRGSRERR
jgi:hypothetical protein